MNMFMRAFRVKETITFHRRISLFTFRVCSIGRLFKKIVDGYRRLYTLVLDRCVSFRSCLELLFGDARSD